MKNIFLLLLLISSVAFSQWMRTGPSTVSTSGMVALTNGTLLVGTIGGFGVYKSTDDGGNWTSSNTGLPATPGYVNSLVNMNDTVFAVVQNYSTGYSTVYRSINAGGSWVAANTGLPTNQSYGKLFVGPNSLFLPLGINKLYRSTDGGQNWAIANTGLPANVQVDVMARNGDQMYAWVSNFSGSGVGLCRSVNNGDTWTLVTSSINSSLYPIPWSFAWNGSTMLAGTSSGLFRSTNNGTDWTQAAGTDLEGVITSGMQLVFHNGVLYCGTPGLLGGTGYLLKSTNNGNSWSQLTNTLPSYQRRALQAFASVGDMFYVGLGVFGVYRTSDSGSTWEPRSHGFPLQPVTYSMIKVGSRILIGTSSGIYQSSDNGFNWYQSQEGIEPVGYPKITALAANGDTVYAGSDQARAYRSVDGGRTFTSTALQLTSGGAVKAFAFTGNAVLAIMTTSNVVYRTTNNGVSWTSSFTGITAGGLTVARIGSDFYVGTVSGLFKSADGGVNWTRIGATVLVNNFQISGIATLGSDIYVSVYNAGTLTGDIYKSADNGNSWAKLNIAFAGSYPSPYSLISMNGNLYTGVYANFSSSATVIQGAAGTTWTDFGQGLVIPGVVRVNSFLVSGNELLAAFANITGDPFDIWRRTIQTTDVKEIGESVPSTFVLEQNYPNPFNPSTVINYKIPIQTHVQLTVYDMLGREVALLENNFQQPGNYSVSFDAGGIGLSSGMYIYRISSGNFSESKKMLLIK